MAPVSVSLHQGRWRRGAVVAVLAALAALAAVVGSLWLFDDFTPNNDEPVYVYQAETFRSGHLTVDAEAHDPHFLPWLHGARDDRLFSVFQPVWPAEMALAKALTGTERSALALNAAAAVILLHLFAAELLHRRGAPLIAAGLLVASPFFLVQAATRLSYTLALVLALAFGWCLLRAGRLGSMRWYGAAGFAWGVLAVDRPLDALLLGSLGVVHLLWGRRPDRLRFTLGAVALGGAVPVAVGAAYNTALTGTPWQFALQAAGGNNDFGFGARQLTPTDPPVLFEFSDAWHALVVNLGELPHWSAGGLLVIPFVVAGLVVLLRRRLWVAAGSLVLVAVLIPAANLFYWGNVLIVSGRHILGPHYYLDLLVPVTILAAVALADLTKRHPRIAAGAVVIMVVLTGLELRPKIDVNREIACTNGHVREEVEASGAENALVLLPAGSREDRVMHPVPTLRNPPDLDGNVLYARNLGHRSVALAQQRPERDLYRVSMRVPRDGNLLRRVPVVDRLRLVGGRAVRIPFRVVNRTGGKVVSVYVVDGRRHVQFLLDEASRRGRTYSGTWVVGPDGVHVQAGTGTSAEAVSGDLPWLVGNGTLAVGAALGDVTDLRRSELFEQRVSYRVTSPTVQLLLPGEAWHRSADPRRLWLPDDVGASFAFRGEARARRFPRADPCASYDIRHSPPDELLEPVRRNK